jgi:hypothetical protein
MNSILFSNQKPINGKKGKSHKLYVFAQDIRIRNSVKILHVSTILRSRPPFSTAKKTWSKVLPILLLKCNPKSKCLSMKKKNAQIESLYPQIWGLEIWSRKRFRPPPICISSPQGKTEVHKHVRADATNICADRIFLNKIKN